MGGFTVARHMALSFTPQILPARAVIRLSGENVPVFLHNLLTCNVQHLAAGQVTYGALLSPQGKIQHDLFVTSDEGGVLIDCVRSQRDDLIKKLMMYRLRAKIDIRADDTLMVAVAPSRPADGRLADPRHPALGERGFLPVGAATGGRSDYDAYRLTLGMADGEGDIGSNEHFPHEANFDLLHGVDFKKGCYVGQEVVSRMQHRGTARSRMLPVTVDGNAPPRGTPVTSGDTSIGTLLSSQGACAMALIRLDRLADAKEPLLSAGVRIHVRKPEWMTIEVTIPEAAQ